MLMPWFLGRQGGGLITFHHRRLQRFELTEKLKGVQQDEFNDTPKGGKDTSKGSLYQITTNKNVPAHAWFVQPVVEKVVSTIL
jgi:hypothetical protein